MEEAKFQISNAKNGLIYLARGEDAKGVVEDFIALENAIEGQEKTLEDPLKDFNEVKGGTTDEMCPKCKKGVLKRRTGESEKGKYDFVGCNNYPECKYVVK